MPQRKRLKVDEESTSVGLPEGDNVFVYLGGVQEVPRGVTHVVIDPSVSTVRMWAFFSRTRLVSVIFHGGVTIIEEGAFFGCCSLTEMKLLSVRDIEDGAFAGCTALSDVEFGDRLETIGSHAFDSCGLMGSIKIPSVRTIEDHAFACCQSLIEMEFGIHLERIGFNSFEYCHNLVSIAIPLKDGLFPFDADEQQWSNQFFGCWGLTIVELVGVEEINNTISPLSRERWTNEMNQEIDRINQELVETEVERTDAIRRWVASVINRLEHFKAEHNTVWQAELKERSQQGTDGNETETAQPDNSWDDDCEEIVEEQEAAEVKKRAELQEMKTQKAEIESQPQPTTAGVQEMTSKASDAEAGYVDDGRNDIDYGEGNNEDVNSAGGMQSHVVPEEIATAIPNDNEKEQQVVVLKSELEKATGEVIKLNEELSRTFEELEAVKSRSQSDKEQLQSRLHEVEAEIEVKSKEISRLEEQLEEEKTEKLSWKAWWEDQKMKIHSRLRRVKTHLEAKSGEVAEMKVEVDNLEAERNEMQALLHSSEVKKESEIRRLAAELSKSNNEVAALKKQVNEMSSELEDVLWQKADIDAQLMNTTTARLKEKAKLKEVTKKFEEADSFWKSRLKEKKVFALLQEKVEQLKGEVRELTEHNKSLQIQLESTDDEGLEAYWKKPSTVSGAVDVNEAAVNLIAGLEMAKQEAELDKARDEIEELRAEIKALSAKNKELRRKRKVKCSSRTRSSSCLQNASV